MKDWPFSYVNTELGVKAGGLKKRKEDRQRQIQINESNRQRCGFKCWSTILALVGLTAQGLRKWLTLHRYHRMMSTHMCVYWEESWWELSVGSQSLSPSPEALPKSGVITPWSWNWIPMILVSPVKILSPQGLPPTHNCNRPTLQPLTSQFHLKFNYSWIFSLPKYWKFCKGFSLFLVWAKIHISWLLFNVNHSPQPKILTKPNPAANQITYLQVNVSGILHNSSNCNSI